MAYCGTGRRNRASCLCEIHLTARIQRSVHHMQQHWIRAFNEASARTQKRAGGTKQACIACW
jgi:hypothetical protein